MAYTRAATPLSLDGGPSMDAEPMTFDTTPVYARPKSRSNGDMAKKAALIGVPVLALAVGGFLLMNTPARHEEPAGRGPTTVAMTQPSTAVLPPAPVETPATAATPTPPAAPVAVREATPARATPARPAPVRRAAAVRATAPSAESAGSNVSATVPAAPRVLDVPPPVVTPEPAPVAPASPPETVPPQ